MRFFSYKKNQFLFVFLFLFCSTQALALKIRFPDEELASESVLPLIDPPNMVLNRNVSLKYRFEIGAGAGFGLDEPFYIPYYGTGHLAFYLTEIHGISITGTYFPPFLSRAGNILSGKEEQESGESLPKKLMPHKAPYPQMMAFINYQYIPYYGKISLTKKWVLNLSIYAFAGPGLLVFHTDDRILAGNLGIGQKLYINKWLGLRADFGFYGYYGPSIAKLNLDEDARDISYNQIKPDQKRPIVNFLINIGVIFLI